MRTERHDAIARLQLAGNHSRLVAQARDFHGPPGDTRRLALDDPYARALARIVDRADRHLQRFTELAVRELDRDRRAQRRIGKRTCQYVASLECSCLAARRVR